MELIFILGGCVAIFYIGRWSAYDSARKMGLFDYFGERYIVKRYIKKKGDEDVDF